MVKGVHLVRDTTTLVPGLTLDRGSPHLGKELLTISVWRSTWVKGPPTLGQRSDCSVVGSAAHKGEG